MAKTKSIIRRVQKGLRGIPPMLEGVGTEVRKHREIFRKNMAPFRKKRSK